MPKPGLRIGDIWVSQAVVGSLYFSSKVEWEVTKGVFSRREIGFR